MSPDTFSRRVERAYTARTRGELNDLARDLPDSGRTVRVVAEVAYRMSSVRAAVVQAWAAPQIARLELPTDDRQRMSIGRGKLCDLALLDDTVSRRHALLVLEEEEWRISDLGSLNGTRVNGLRVVDPTPVRVGDVVSFGRARYRLTER